ncbi:uncharacterized protein LOC112155693 isoform X2 [Oryzias melastigma]|nr:uncharacterized protein LOC112155693 isoform X2 [Oryzias melastigma]XP_036072835.1 uncharacterized protein LOC112155693 isoform X2 [Oryzias melastigma]
MIKPSCCKLLYFRLYSSVFALSLTVWTQDLASSVEFSGLFWGQNYCAVANFSFPTFSMAASPKSAPRCVKAISKAGMLLPVLSLGICLISLFLFLLLTVFLQKRRRSTPEQESQPKNQASSHDLLSLGLAPTDPQDIHLEFDQSSISSPSSLHSGQNLSLTVEDMSVKDPVHGDPGTDAADWDGGGRESVLTIPPASHPSEGTWDQ